MYQPWNSTVDTKILYFGLYRCLTTVRDTKKCWLGSVYKGLRYRLKIKIFFIRGMGRRSRAQCCQNLTLLLSGVNYFAVTSNKCFFRILFSIFSWFALHVSSYDGLDLCATERLIATRWKSLPTLFLLEWVFWHI